MHKKIEHRKIVIYGGAFNPPRIGHAAVIKMVLEYLSDPTHKDVYGASEVWVMPSADRADKKVGVSGEHRLKMLEIMLQEELPDPKIPITISELEVGRARPTVTYETKAELEKLYPDDEFWFLVGSDSLADVEKIWVNGKELYQEANFLVVGRPGFAMPEKLPSHYVFIGPVDTAENFSSTMIRKAILGGESSSGYVTTGVLAYIYEHGLYKK
jgi:nicotinate-nucleotide adenylyltransferase